MFYSSPYLSKGFNSVQTVGYTLGWRLNIPRMRSVPQGIKKNACLCLHFVGLVAGGLARKDVRVSGCRPGKGRPLCKVTGASPNTA